MTDETRAVGYEPETCLSCGERLVIEEDEQGYWLVCEECHKGWFAGRRKPDLWKKI